MIRDLRPISFNKTPNILLLGNGINYAYGDKSWNDIINSLSTGEYDSNTKVMAAITKLPETLKTIVISSDNVGDGMKVISEKMLKKTFNGEEHRDIYKKLASMEFDSILTTNYTYEIEKSIDDRFSLKSRSKSKYRFSTTSANSAQNQFGLFKYISVNNVDIWHIHGEAALPDSMVMGHYFYGKLLCEIQKRIPIVIRSFKSAQKNQRDYYPKSWIDYFLLGNIHVLGFGMNPSEMDLWWLINCKKAHFSDCGKIYYYEPNLEKESKLAVCALANTMGIECYTERIRKNSSKEYIAFYNNAIERIKRIIDNKEDG